MSQSDRENVIKAEVIANAWKDAGYKERLKKDPAGVLKEAGIDVPEGVNIHVLENTPNEMNVVLQHPEAFEESRAKFMEGLNWMFPLPEGVKVHLTQNTAKDRHMVIPQAPDLGDLSDDDLMSLASGVGANVNNAVNVNEGANVNVGGNVNAGVNAAVGVDIAVVAIVAT